MPGFAPTKVQFSSKSGGIIETFTGTTVIPASTATVTRTVDLGSTVIATTTVIKTATSTVIPVPSATTSITFDGLIITLDPGGTPINSMVPTFISQPSAITPNWSECPSRNHSSRLKLIMHIIQHLVFFRQQALQS